MDHRRVRLPTGRPTAPPDGGRAYPQGESPVALTGKTVPSGGSTGLAGRLIADPG